jgi:Fe-S cluster assembly protein SufB
VAAVQETVRAVEALAAYEHGFVTDIAQEFAPKGLSEEVVRYISAKKEEPQWMLDWRLEAYARWLELEEPTWAKVVYTPTDYDALYYYAAHAQKPGPKSLDEVDPEILATYAKLGIPLREQEVLAGVEGAAKYAVDAVFDSVSVVTTFKAELAKEGVLFMSFSEAVREHPELVRKYLGSVVPPSDNYFACLNSAVFSDGSFVYIPPGVKCPMELSTYFRINAQNTGTIRAYADHRGQGAKVSYLEGCTAPQRDENQLHAAVVELIALDDAEIKYSTVQNWYPGDPETGKGGIYNFVTKRADCRGARSKVSWTQVETGSASPGSTRPASSRATARGRVLLDRHHQRPPAGRHRHQDDPPGRQHALAHHQQGHQRGQSANTYRGQVSAHPKAHGARNFTQCDSLLIGKTPPPTPCPTSRPATARPSSSTKPPPPACPRTSSSTPSSAGSRRRGGAAAGRRLREGGAPDASDGVRGRGAEAGRDLARRERWVDARR